jgi:peptide/nickel transport system permease protein
MPRHFAGSMFAFILRRLLQAVVVMVAVAFIAFLLFQYVGDPVVFLLGQDASPQIRQLRSDLGPRPALLRAVLALPPQRGAGRVRPQPAPGRQGVPPHRPSASRPRWNWPWSPPSWRWPIGIPMGVYAALRRGTS